MEENVLFQNDIIDMECNIPTLHLSFIIQSLLPTHILKENNEKCDELSQRWGEEMNEFCCNWLIGSFVEGYNIPSVIVRSNPYVFEPHHDIDMLLALPWATVLSEEEFETRYRDVEDVGVLDIQDTHSGYARIQSLNYDDLENEFLEYQEETKKTYFNVKRIHDKWFCDFKEDDDTHILKGPAIRKTARGPFFVEDLRRIKNQVRHDVDIIIAFPCLSWPSVARNWIERQRRGNWINNLLLEKIEDFGVFLVPVPHKYSLHPELECRISFALAEVALSSEVITDYQKQCYVFLKVIHYIKLKPLDILTSYHLKTVFLYSCEKLPPNVWRENLGSCLLYMIDCLIECVSRKHLPSFFIPENNLIDYFTDDEAEKVIHILRNIRKNPVEPILVFTEPKLFAMHSLNIPFREIVKPVLKDSIQFIIHKNIQRALTDGFLPAFFRLCYLSVIENTSYIAVEFIKEILPTLRRLCGGGISFAYIIHSCIKNFFYDIKLQIKFIEKSVRGFFNTSQTLVLNRALEYIMCKLTYQKLSKSQKRRLHKLTKRFQTSFEKDSNSTLPLENCWCPSKQKRFEELVGKLHSCIDKILDRQLWLDSDSLVLGEGFMLQKKLEENGKHAISSLSIVYYLLFQIVLKHNYIYEDRVDKKIWQYIKQYYEHINIFLSYSLFENYDATKSITQTSKDSLSITRDQFERVCSVEDIYKGVEHLESALTFKENKNPMKQLKTVLYIQTEHNEDKYQIRKVNK